MTRVGPGGTIGIVGGGQLARMISLEARRMGYRVAVLDPDPLGPAAQVADVHVAGAFQDVAAADELARVSDVVTLDTEHVPVDILERIQRRTPVHPSAAVLRIVQDRLAQRRFLASQGAPQPPHAQVTDAESLRAAARAVGLPAVLKTRRSGYDGKGQARVHREEDLADAFRAIGEQPAILEAFIDFDKEVSVLLARDLAGDVRFHPMAENVHRRHVLHTSRAPARVPPSLAAQAEELALRIASALGHVGMMAIELFVTRDGQLLVNEIAPRTHNSGHYSFGACATSQFEQHVRAICGLPLGDPSLLRPAAMLNLLGDLWQGGPPDFDPVLSHSNARLHLYGKKEAFPGRKMGHVLVLDGDPDRAAILADTIAGALESGRQQGDGAST